MKRKRRERAKRESAAKKGLMDSDNVTLDTKVVCFICGQKGPLRSLSKHQITAHAALQFVPAKSDAVTCSICKCAMPSASLERHMKRKHPAAYSKMQREEETQKLANRPISSVISESSAPVPNHADIVNFEQIPSVFEQSVKKERIAEPPIIQTRTVVVKTQSLLSVEEDDDGFFDLVITEFCED